jgi:hypothetical protein
VRRSKFAAAKSAKCRFSSDQIPSAGLDSGAQYGIWKIRSHSWCSSAKSDSSSTGEVTARLSSEGYFAGMLITAVIVVEIRRPPFSLITPNS